MQIEMLEITKRQKKSKKITFRTTPDILEKAENLAKTNNITLSRTVDAIMNCWFSKTTKNDMEAK